MWQFTCNFPTPLLPLFLWTRRASPRSQPRHHLQHPPPCGAPGPATFALGPGGSVQAQGSQPVATAALLPQYSFAKFSASTQGWWMERQGPPILTQPFPVPLKSRTLPSLVATLGGRTFFLVVFRSHCTASRRCSAQYRSAGGIWFGFSTRRSCESPLPA